MTLSEYLEELVSWIKPFGTRILLPAIAWVVTVNLLDDTVFRRASEMAKTYITMIQILGLYVICLVGFHVSGLLKRGAPNWAGNRIMYGLVHLALAVFLFIIVALVVYRPK